MVKKTERQLIRELTRPDFKGLDARQLRFVSTSTDRKISTGARKELKKRGLKLRGRSFPR